MPVATFYDAIHALYRDGRPTREVGPDELIELTDHGGIDTVMLSAWCQP